ncbi:hypothetical protein K440DRAFT_682332 [Wilcoxina mikolae CBS 423.85]|nr:hypothetical protein K440DRAFT_682332 [Wilcoxina mikolae CBS 423.85]
MGFYIFLLATSPDFGKSRSRSATSHILFFSNQNEALCIVNSISRSLINQLLLKKIKPCKTLEAYEQDLSLVIDSNDKLWEILQAILKDFAGETVYCIIDGLDECEQGSGRDATIQFLKKIKSLFPAPTTRGCHYNGRGPTLKLLVTSRPLLEVSDELEHFRSESIDAAKQIWSGSSKNGRKLLLEKVERTFLWVSIVVKKLERICAPNIASLKHVINGSSTKLDTLYTDIFEEIRKGSDLEQKWVIWATFGKRPLILRELEVASAIQLDSTNEESMKDHKIDLTPEILTSMVGIILQCTDDGLIQLIHQSAREYILEKNLFASFQFCSGLDPNIYIAKICMTYMIFDEFKPGPLDRLPKIRERNRNYPFLEYTARHWHAHIREERDADHISDLLFQIVNPKSTVLRLWCFVASITDINAADHPLKIAANKDIEWLASYLLSPKNTMIEISDDELGYAAELGSPSIAKLMLERGGNVGDRNRAVGRVWIHGNGVYRQQCSKTLDEGNEMMDELANRRDIAFTKEAVENVARLFNEKTTKSLLRNQSGIAVTKAMIIGVARNRKSGNGVMRVLLDASECVELDAEIIHAAAQNGTSGKEVMGVFMDTNVAHFTQEPIIMVIRNFEAEFMHLLLERKEIAIMDDILIAVSEQRMTTFAQKCGVDMMGLILEKDISIELTEVVLAAIAEKFDKEVMKLLLAKDCVEITENVVVVAARNWWNGKDVMELLLARDSGIEITEAVVVAAAKNRRSGKEVMQLLLAKVTNTELTEAVMAAASIKTNGREVMEVLLASDAGVEVTEAVVVATAGNQGNCKKMMELLLARGGIRITEAVVVAAAGNWWNGNEVMELLLARHGIEITEAVVMAAERNMMISKNVMNMLRERVSRWDCC